MMAALLFIKELRESVGDPAFALITGIPAFLYARWTYLKDNLFTSVNGDKRTEVLKAINKLWQGELSDFKKAIIKSLYERIGLTFQIEINRQIINFLVDEGISYRHQDVKYFLQCRDVIKTSATSFTFFVKKASRDKQILGSIPAVVALLVMGSVYGSMQLAPLNIHGFTFLFFPRRTCVSG